MFAAYHTHNGAVRALIEAGCNVNEQGTVRFLSKEIFFKVNYCFYFLMSEWMDSTPLGS